MSNLTLITKYKMTSKLGEVEELAIIELSEYVPETSFNQNIHEHSIGSSEIMRLNRIIAAKFVKDNSSLITEGEKELSNKEILAIRLVLGINRSELSKEVGVHKSTITRIIRGELKANKTIQILLMLLLEKKLEFHSGEDYSLKRSLHCKFDT